MGDERSSDKDSIGAIDRAIDILFFLQKEGREQGVTQIASGLGIYKSTVYRTLATLERRSFVHQNPENGKYWLGIKLYSLGMLIGENLPLKQIAFPFAKDLAEKYREVVHIGVLDKTASLYPQLIILDKIESKVILSMTPPAGSVSPSHCSAVGKALLAFCPPEYLARFAGVSLPAYTHNTITDWSSFLEELARIRESGYALDNEELELGLTCIGAPIFARNREAVAALSLSGPTSRLKSDSFEEIVADVQKMARQISRALQ